MLGENLTQKSWVYPSYVWLIQLIVAFLVLIFFNVIIFPHHPPHLPQFWAWDGGWYKIIAEKGYYMHGSDTPLRAAAFYPLYPLASRILMSITGFSYEIVSFSISNLSFLAALIVLYQFVRNEHGEVIAKHTLWLLTAFPTAMFYNCAYTESVNLLFLVLFFYSLQKNKWYPAMICGFFSAVTHGTGMLLILPGAVYLWCKRRDMDMQTLIVRTLSLLIIPLSVVFYMIYLYVEYDAPLAFIYAHKYWNHKMNIPILHIFAYLTHMYQQKPPLGGWYTIIETMNGVCTLMMVLMGILMLTVKRKQFTLPIQVFYVVTLLVSISSGPGGHLDSFARYVVVLFPGFIVWSYFTKAEAILLLSLSIMLPVKTILMGLFANGYWIT